jgi:hypothetical protein
VSITTRFPVSTNGVDYGVAPAEDTIADGVRTGAIVQARLVDELTSAPVDGPIIVTAAGKAFEKPRARMAVNPRSTDGGIAGLVGVAVNALPLIGSTSYEVGLTVSAPGYVSTTRTKMHGPLGTTFPQTFPPADLGDIAMHRDPVMLFGRANLRTPTTFDPVNGATVRVSGFWRALPTLTVSPPPSLPNLAAVDPALYAPRTAGANVNVVALTADTTHEKTLMRPAMAGSTEVYLSDRVNLAAPVLLGIDESDPSRAEWVMVTNVVGSTTTTEPAVATLAFPLARSHAARALAHPTTVGAPTGTEGMSLDAIAGDTTLFVTGTAGLAPGAVEITGGGTATNEYHRLSLYETSSDPDGQWRLPPLSRVALVTLTAVHAPDTSPTVPPVTIEYPRREQRIDFVFT